MELSEKTMQVLKNYSQINPNVVIDSGSSIKTVTEAKNLLSKADLDVEFPISFGVYDLNEFLNVLSLVDTPRLDFQDTHVLISDSAGRSKIKYFYSDPDILTTPTKDIIMPESEVTFTLDRDTLSRIKRAASVLGHTEMSVSHDGTAMVLSVIDSDDKTSNVFSIAVDGQAESTNFNFVFKISNLKMIDGDYLVSISSKLISHFVNKDTSIEYWCAIEQSSTYGE